MADKISEQHYYSPQMVLTDRTWPDQVITKAPQMCEVQLRDGNQSLLIPMNVVKKLEYFRAITRMGFKEVEIGFPSASIPEFNFAKDLIQNQEIPDDVAIQVLVQSREKLINRTFEAIKDARKSIVHFYLCTNPVQRKHTLNMSKDQVKAMAVDAAKMIMDSLVDFDMENRVQVQFSTESGSDTEPEFVLEVNNAVIEEVNPRPENPLIINFPETVQRGTVNQMADYLEWLLRNIDRRDSLLASFHGHNDCDNATAMAELALLACFDRIEGTFAGNGERAGNLDIIKLALNLESRGIHTGLDFSFLEEVKAIYRKVTGMSIPQRDPYLGEEVFTAYSGSHQDALKKGFDARESRIQSGENPVWQEEIHYIHVNPDCIGRKYEAVKINSQSGKAAVAYVLQDKFGISLPKIMQGVVHMQSIQPEVEKREENEEAELTFGEVFTLFKKDFVNTDHIKFLESSVSSEGRDVRFQGYIAIDEKEFEIEGIGNGPVNALINGLEKSGLKSFSLVHYDQKIRGTQTGSDAEAITFVGLQTNETEKVYWGCGMNESSTQSALDAVVSAMNQEFFG